MANRFDARVKADLPVLVAPYKGETETAANISQLSLSGLLLEGLTTKIPDTFFLKLELPRGEGVELYGDVVRVQDSESAVRFYLPERETMSKLWEFIKDRIKFKDVCPYCNRPIISYSDNCPKCGWYLNFKDKEYLDKHLQETFLQRIISRMESLDSGKLQRVLHFIDKELLIVKGRSVDEQFVGTSEKMFEVFSMIRKVAPTENAVLILGESGTGKELTAKAIHERSPRKDRPFVVINCAAIPETLLESELFGYERGAFTGAYTNKKGKFELADSGTIFLDEIGEMSMSVQAKLLRVLEEKTMERLGGKSPVRVNVRVIASTNRNLEQEVKEGRFRLDLYHRINTFTIFLPSLKTRGEDKIILAKYFLRKLCLIEGVSRHFSKEALEAINSYSWPGNVRELINKIRRAIVVSEGKIITPADLSMEISEKGIISLREAKTFIEKQRLLEVLEMTSHNISKAASLLGISRPTIYSLIKKYRIGSQ